MPSITIGKTENGPIRIRDDERDTHMHVCGLSKVGKSYFLEQLIRQDIRNGHGVCVIDPHGELYDNLLAWIVEHDVDKHRTVHLLNPSDATWTFGWNPLALDSDLSIHSRVGAMVDAFVQVWGNADLAATPRLSKCLTAVLFVLAHHKLSLAEARLLTSLTFRDIARSLTDTVGNEEFETVWREFLYEYKNNDFLTYFESTVSRMLPFVSDPIIRNIVGQTDNLINFKECMDKRHIVLVNLKRGKHLSPTSARLLGSLLTSDLYNTAFERDVEYAKRTPFFLTIDECARFVNEPIAASLDETRKFGLHICLSHQRLAQLRELGDSYYEAVMAGAQLKVVFNPGDEDTADTFARLLFRKEFDLEVPKHILDKPVVVDYETISLFGETSSEAIIKGRASAEGDSFGASTGISQVYDAEGNVIGGHVITSGDNTGESKSRSSFESHNSSTTHSRHDALKPVLEIMPTTTYNLEELLHLAMVELLSLPKRHAYIFSPQRRVQRFSTVDIAKPAIAPRVIGRIRTLINKTSPYLIETNVAMQNIRERRHQLAASRFDALGTDDDDGLA